MEEALGRPLATPIGRAEMLFQEWRADVSVSYSTNSTATLVDAIARNDFVGILPMAVGDARNDLHFCCPVAYPTPSLWIVYPERLRGAPHVRAFVDHLTEHVISWRRRSG